MHVKAKELAVVFISAQTHRACFGPRVARALTLKAQLIEQNFGRFELSSRIEQHQINYAFACTTGHGGAADVFDLHARQMFINDLRDASSYLHGAWIIVVTSSGQFFVWLYK